MELPFLLYSVDLPLFSSFSVRKSVCFYGFYPPFEDRGTQIFFFFFEKEYG